MVRVLLADDHALVRSGIRSLLEAAGIEVVGEARDGAQLVELAATLRPDVVLADVTMPGMGGIEATRHIRVSHPDVRVLMLSMHADRQYVRDSAAAGAAGYVLKDAAFSDLLRAVQEVSAGPAGQNAGSIAQPPPKPWLRPTEAGASGALRKLSAREREVLRLVAEGRSSSQIGKILFISARTVDTHRKNIISKLGVRTIAGLTKFAIRHRISPLT